MKKDGMVRRARIGLWMGVCGFAIGLCQQLQVAYACADPFCGNVTCICPGSCSPRLSGGGFACCCGNGNTGCCTYSCYPVTCGSQSGCPSGIDSLSGTRLNPYTCDGTNCVHT